MHNLQPRTEETARSKIQLELGRRRTKTRKLLASNTPVQAKLQTVSRQLRRLQVERVQDIVAALQHADYKFWVAETKARIDKINANIRASNHE